MTTLHSHYNSYVSTHEYEQKYYSDKVRHKLNKNNDQSVRNNKVKQKGQELAQSVFRNQLTRSQIFPSTALYWTRLPLNSAVPPLRESEWSRQHAYCFFNNQGTFPCTLANLLHTIKWWTFSSFVFEAKSMIYPHARG